MDSSRKPRHRPPSRVHLHRREILQRRNRRNLRHRPRTHRSIRRENRLRTQRNLSRNSKAKNSKALEAKHPFLDRTSKVILANFVTTETGTGAVHIAPGHGADDYVAGQQNGLAVLSPVDDEGHFTEEVGLPELVGQHVFKSNKRIIEILAESGHLLGQEDYHHSYPHCWRSKTPIIFRAVEQFFISLDGLRGQALEEIDKAKWLPAWGRNRIYGTVESRPDWCISRQRTWGVPLPVFFDENNKAILTSDLALKVADLVEKEGTNVWFETSDEELAAKLGLPAGLKKGKDTLDVWIDSGCSHAAVMDTHPELHCPADLYLEATDQHRGWFQSSLMLSTAYRGHAPYKTVMTHGFVVDKDTGKKTSKSDDKKKGKPTDAAHFYNQYGADIVRLWVSSVDWQNEVPFGEDLFKQVAEPYRRLRNTLRILLGNLDGYGALPSRHANHTPSSTNGSSNASTPSPKSASPPTSPSSSEKSSTPSTSSAPPTFPPSTSMR